MQGSSHYARVISGELKCSSPLRFPILLCLAAWIGTGCAQAEPVSSGEDPTLSPSVEVITPTQSEGHADDSLMSTVHTMGLTYLGADGNRYIEGRGNLPTVDALDIELEGRPEWVVGAAASEGSIWVAVLEDGRVQGFHVIGSSFEPIDVVPSNLAPGMPPALIVEGDRPTLLTAGEGAGSELTHAVPLQSDLGATAYIAETGEVVIERGNEVARFTVSALPDARLLVDETGRILLLSDPTTRYGHGVLGDAIEAGSISLIDTTTAPALSRQIAIEGERVIEGISPIWTDLNGDRVREIIVTESDAEQGARIVVFDEDGNRVAESAPIGRGFRWRHQLAAAPFGPEGEVELVAVLTPHIGGIVEFFGLQGDRLEVVAQVPGFSSHLLGSPNLDRAVSGDFDGEGSVELLVPDQAQEVLGAIRRNANGAEMVWSIPVGDQLATNLAVVTMPNGVLALGAGREDRVLRLWISTDGG